jgi:hypothetical protein
MVVVERARAQALGCSNGGEREDVFAMAKGITGGGRRPFIAGQPKRHAAGWKENGFDALHVFLGVKRSFYCDGTEQALQRACQGKWRTCVPHLHNLSNTAEFWAHMSAT